MTDPVENRIGIGCTKHEQQELYYALLPELPLFEVLPPGSLPGTVHATAIHRLWGAQGGRCSICGHPLNPTRKSVEATKRIRHWLDTTREHVWPTTLGYTDANNILLAHGLCNGVKSDADPTAEQLALLKKVYGDCHD